jgi:hypothetical protein
MKMVLSTVVGLMLMCSAVAENTDNLLSNGNFSNQLNDWVVEDATKTKHDANCYAGGTDASGLCKSVRWSSNLGKTISQTIDNLDPGYDINNINVSFTALGCNNEANSSTWCSQGTDYDKVQATIQLSYGETTETYVLEQSLDYNDGTQDYNLSTQTLSDWTTDNTTIDFSITGVDTGNWSGWYAPIVDNINLNLTISETPVAVIEPMVIEPMIAEPQVIENTVIQGLDLETELITDVILDMPIDLPIDTQLVSVNLPEIDDMVIEEPVIEINEPVVEEVQIEENITEGGGEVEGETTESNESTSEEIEEEVAQETSEEASEEEESPEPKSTPEPKVASKKVDTKSVPKTTASVKKNTGFQQIDIVNLVTLTKIQETIKIQETVSLIQEQIYEQSIDLIASDITIDGIIGDTSRWRDSVVGQRYQYEVEGYRRSNQ